jgi:hypothetical protein
MTHTHVHVLTMSIWNFNSGLAWSIKSEGQSWRSIQQCNIFPLIELTLLRSYFSLLILHIYIHVDKEVLLHT